MNERLYRIRQGQGYFDAGLARGKQVLLGNIVHEIIVHWFDMAGNFLELQRFQMDVDPPAFPGTTIYRTDSNYHRQVDAEIARMKQRLGFREADILLRAFESDEAAIYDLPGEYEQFLESPETADSEEREHVPQEIAKWRAEGRFVIQWCVDYWLTAEGEVISHG